MRKLLSTLVLIAFVANTTLPAAYAQEIFLPAPGAMVHLSPSFNPPILKGIKVYPENPFLFDFILDNGQSAPTGDNEEAGKLVKYFLASLTTPENEMWVNLSPYEKDRIVPERFGQTEMGRDLLAQDYILKQITASLIYPEDELGKKFWDRVYAEAKKKFGTTDIPVNTFNKVWIVPAKAVVYENPQSASAYVVESSLNVMLEEDYLALQKSEAAKIDDKQTSVIGNQIIREVVIPALTKEVNEGKNFAQLRQIYNSLILAAWYKKKIKDSIISQVYVDQNKVAGVNIDNPNEKQIIYEQYLEAFKKGAYNYIKEEVDSATQEVIPKKYFSGGFAAQQLKLDIRRDDESLLSSTPVVDAEILQMQLVASSPADDSAELLASAEDRFEKPYSKLVQKPERQLNENVAEKNSAIEIQMEIDRLIPDLDQIIFAHESQGLQATEDLRDRQSEFLQGLRSLAIDIRVSVNDELEFIGLSKILKDLRASRNRIYYAIEKADRQKDVEALKALNQQAIRNNRLVLKAQLLLAAKMFENRVTLKNPAFIYSAVRETLRGALNSAQMLEEELGYRIGRLQAAKMVREIETSDWLGNIVRTFRMSGFDIKVAPATPEDREPAITVRQQHYINVHTRLDQTLTDIRQGRVAAAQTQLDLLRDIYHVETANVYERYSEIDAGLKAIRAKTNGLVEGQILRRSSAEAQAFAADIEELKSLVEVPKMRVWMDVNFEEGLDSAFRGYIHRFAGYIQEIGTITRNKTTLEFFASKLRAAEKAQSLSQRNLTILVNGMAPIVQWAQRGFVFEKQRVVINLEPVVEKIKSGDYEGAQGDISLAVTKLQSRLEEIERIVGHSKRQAASVFSAFRDKDISRRAGEISGLLQKSEFAAGFRELEMLIELYFNQDQVEPGYIRAALSLHKAAGKIRAMQRSPNPKYLLSQTLSLLRLAQKDVRHKYSLKVDLIDPNGTKTPAIYINPGTTVLGLLNSRGINPASVQVSIGAGWISRGDLGRTQIPDGKTVVLKAAVSSSAILANAPLSPEAKLRVGRHVDEVMTLLTVNRDEPGYQAAFYKDSNQDDSESLPQQFRRDVQNITDDTEIRFFALALDEVWKTNGYEKDLGSVFEYAADIFSDYKSTPSQIKKGFAWFYKFLEAAPLLERTKALRLLVLAFNNHLRSGGFHAEDETTRIGLSADSFPLDAELLLGNDRDLPGPQIFQRYILSLLELQQSPAWTEVIPKNKKPNRLGLTYEDMFLWALVLAVDPTVYGEGYAQYPVDLLEGYLSKYFGEDVEVENSGIKFVEKAFNHESLRDKKPQIQALLQKALNITAAQWEDKGQRDPYSFALKLDYLWPILSAPSFWSDKSLFVLGDPMLMLGLSLSYLPRRMREEFTMLPRVEDRNKILWEQLPGGLRPLYVKAFGSAQLAAIFPGLRIATVASSSTMESDAGVGQRAGEFFQRIVDEKTTTDPATFWSFLLKEMNSYVTEKNLQAIWLADSLPAGVEWKSEVALFAQKMRDLWNTPTDGQGASLNAIYGSLFPLMTLSINYDYSSNLLRLRLEHQWLYEFLSIAAPREQAKSLWLIMVSNVIHMRNGGMHREEDEFDQPVSHDVEILYGRTGYAGAISKFVENIKLLSTQAGFEDAVEDVRDPWTGETRQVKLKDILMWGLAASLDATLNYPQKLIAPGESFPAAYRRVQTNTVAMNFMVDAQRESLGQLGLFGDEDEKLIADALLRTDAQWEQLGLLPPVRTPMEARTLQEHYFLSSNGEEFPGMMFSFLLAKPADVMPTFFDQAESSMIKIRRYLNQQAWSQMDRYPQIAARFKTQLKSDDVVGQTVLKSSSAIIDAAGLSEQSRRKVEDKVDFVVGLLERERNRFFNSGYAEYEYLFFASENYDDTRYPDRFIKSFQELTRDDEIETFARALKSEWRERGFDKDLGSVFEYAAEIFSDYLGHGEKIKKGYQWFYRFLNAATPMEKALALRVLTVSFGNHLRSDGFHPENSAGVVGFSEESFPLDHELLLGNNRDLLGPQILQRYILSLLEIEQTPEWSAVIAGEDGRPNPFGLTNEDVFLWALVLLVDPTVYEPWTLNTTRSDVNAYLARYFGENVDAQNAGGRYLATAFNHSSLRSQGPRLAALLQKAFSITDQQWSKKGQRSPFEFAFAIDNLKSVLANPLFWNSEAIRLAGNPMLMLGLDPIFLPEKMRFLLQPASGGKKHGVLKQQGWVGLRPLYARAYGSAGELGQMFPGLGEILDSTIASSQVTTQTVSDFRRLGMRYAYDNILPTIDSDATPVPMQKQPWVKRLHLSLSGALARLKNFNDGMRFDRQRAQLREIQEDDPAQTQEARELLDLVKHEIARAPDFPAQIKFHMLDVSVRVVDHYEEATWINKKEIIFNAEYFSSLSYDARIAVLGHELGHLMYTEYEDSPFLTIREIELRADLVGLLVGRLVSEFFSVQAFGELLAAVHNLPYDPLTEFYRTPPESRRIDYAHLDDEARIAFIRKADKLSNEQLVELINLPLSESVQGIRVFAVASAPTTENILDVFDYDKGIPVEEEVLDLAKLQQIKTDGAAKSEIYYRPDDFQHTGDFYKLLRWDVDVDLKLKNKLLYEANALYALNQANIPGVPVILARGIAKDGRIYIKLKGIPASRVLADSALFREYPAERKISYFRHVAEILAAVHDQGIAHGDIKIENLIINPQTNEPMIIDFGDAEQADAYSVSRDILNFGNILRLNFDQVPEVAALLSGMRVYSMQNPSYMHTVAAELRKLEDKLAAVPLSAQKTTASSAAADVSVAISKKDFAALGIKEFEQATQSVVYTKSEWPFVLKTFIEGFNRQKDRVFSSETEAAYRLAFDKLAGLVADFTFVNIGDDDGKQTRGVIMRNAGPKDLQRKIQELYRSGRINEIKTLLDEHLAILVNIMRRGVFPIDPKLNNFGVPQNHPLVLDPGDFTETWDTWEVLKFQNQLSDNLTFLETVLGSGELTQYYTERLEVRGLSSEKIYSTIPAIWNKDNPVQMKDISAEVTASLRASSSVSPNKGGIDFNADKLNLETQSGGGEIKFEMSPQQLRELRDVPGFTPVIINIQPMTNVRMFLGLKEDPKIPLAMSNMN